MTRVEHQQGHMRTQLAIVEGLGTLWQITQIQTGVLLGARVAPPHFVIADGGDDGNLVPRRGDHKRVPMVEPPVPSVGMIPVSIRVGQITPQ